MNIMLLERNDDLSFLLESFIEEYSKLTNNYIQLSSSKDAINYLEKNEVDLIISEETLSKGLGSEVFNFVSDKYPGTKFLLTTGRNLEDLEYPSDFLDNPNNVFMQKPFNINILKSTIYTILDGKVREHGFLGVSKAFFHKYPSLEHDLYLRLGDERFVKILSPKSDKNLSKEDLNILFKKDVPFVYLSEKDYINYSNNCLEELSQAQESLSLEHVSEILKNIPISESLKRSLNESMTKFEKSIQKSLDKDLLLKILDKESFLVKHSELIVYINSYIVSKLKWGQISITDKLIQAAFLHDLYMIENNETEINHVFKAVELAKELFNDVDLEKILENHHEKPDGSGFPKKLDSVKIQPLSSSFILSHDLAIAIIEQRDLKRWYSSKSTYYTGNFKKPYEVLSELVIKIDEMI